MCCTRLSIDNMIIEAVVIPKNILLIESIPGKLPPPV